MVFLVPLKDTTLETLLWYCLKVLSVNGLKVEGPVTDMSWRNRIQYFVTVFLLVYYFEGGPINHILHGEDSRVQVGVCLMASGAMAVNKAIWFYIYRYEIADVCSQARIVETTVGEAAGGLRRAQITSLAFGATTMFSGIVLLLKPVFSAVRALPDDFITLPGFYPPLESPNYEISYSVCGAMVLIGVTVTCGYRMLFAALVEHCASRIRLLAVKVETIADVSAKVSRKQNDENSSELSVSTHKEEHIDEKLREIIIRHLEVKTLVEKMRSTYDRVMGFDFALIFIAVCTLLMKMDQAEMLFVIQYISYVFGEIMMYCYCGQHLIDASVQLERAAYACGWERWATKYHMRRAVFMIIHATQRPLILTAAPWKNRIKYCLTLALLVNWFYIAPLYHIMLGLEHKVTEVYCILATGTLAINKTTWFYFNRNKISALCAHARAVENATEVPARDLKRAAVTNIIFFGTIAFGAASFMLKSLVGRERSLPESYSTIPGLHPALESPNYEISLIIYGLAISSGALMGGGYRMLFATFIEHSAARVKLIGTHLEQLAATQSTPTQGSTKATLEKPLRTKLLKLINRHMDVIVLVDMMQSTYNTVITIDFALVFIALSTVLMKFDDSDRMFAMRYAVFLLGEMLMYCYCGQRLINANEGLQRSVYACGWEGWGNERNMRRAVLMMQRSTQRPLRLTAARKLPLSHDTFQLVMRGCYTFIAAVNAKN